MAADDYERTENPGPIADFYFAFVDYKARSRKRRLAAGTAVTIRLIGAIGQWEPPFDTMRTGDLAVGTT
jgi:hypothetical protein